MTRAPRADMPSWMGTPFTFEEVRDALAEAWISYRTPRRVQGSTHEDRLMGVPAEHRGEHPRKAPAIMIGKCMWSGDPYGEGPHPDYLVKLMNALERFKRAGLMDSEPTFAVSGRQFEPEYDLWFVRAPLDG